MSEIEQRPTPAPGRLGQGTAVEMSRAVAQVQAMVLVAKQDPRDVQCAVLEMRDACKQLRLAEKAFYRYSRGGKQVTGPSIHLARELARCWGNIDYGVAELLRDDEHGQSEILAHAWDMQNNTRNSAIFINPHKRAGADSKRLFDARDVYENNANNGARRVREAIFAVLPGWFADEAQEICAATLEHGGGIALPKRIANCIEKFSELRVSVDMLEAKVGRPSGKWSAVDAAQLAVVFGSLQRGEVRVEDEFPQPKVTVEELAQRASKPGRAKPVAKSVGAPHDNHPEGVWTQGCPGCAAESDAVDQEAADA